MLINNWGGGEGEIISNVSFWSDNTQVSKFFIIMPSGGYIINKDLDEIAKDEFVLKTDCDL